MTDNPIEPSEAIGKCPTCGFTSDAADRFCRNCGAELKADTEAVLAVVARLLPERIDALLKERFKEQKLVEVETAELLADRAIKWLKILGFFVGIPVVLIAVFLSFLGIQSWSDLKSVAQKTAELQSNLTAPQQQLANAGQQIKQLQADLGTAKSQISQVGARQDTLEDQLKTIRGRLGFCPGEQASDATKEKLEDGLSRFVVWLQNIGFSNLDDHIDVCLYSLEAPPPIPGVSATQPNSFYYNNKLYIHKSMADDLSVALREYSHYTLTKAVGSTLFVQNEIESALADYLPASFLKSPIIGANLGALFGASTPYLRTLANDLTYPTAPGTGSTPGDNWFGHGQVWAAALWTCRGTANQVDKLIRPAWERSNAGGGPNDDRVKRFAAVLLAAPAPAGSCLTDDVAKRGLPH